MNSDQDQPKKIASSSSKVRPWHIALILFLIVLIWIGGWILIDLNVASEATRGQFGDKFGAVNSLFSGLAFAGIILTLLLQREDLSLQRIEIENAKHELEKQNLTLRRQRFENTFFQLITLHLDIVDKLRISSFGQREAFTYFISLMTEKSPEFRVFAAIKKLSREEFHKLKSTKTIPDALLSQLDEDEKTFINDDLKSGLVNISKFEDTDLHFHTDLLNKNYAIAHEKSRDKLSHYFRNLYNTLRFIDESEDANAEQKRMYARTLRAQLSDEELTAILYNCTAIVTSRAKLELGYPKMTRLVHKYDLLQNLNKSSLIHDQHYQVFVDRCVGLESAK